MAHMRQKHYADSSSSASEDSNHHRERMLADLLRQRQAQMFGSHQPGIGGMHRHSPLFLGGRGMMGGYSTHGSPMGMGLGMGMGMGFGGGMGMGSGMGMHPAMGMPVGLGMGVGMGAGRSLYGHSPYATSRHTPFGYGSPGPPRAHSFRSPFSHSRHSSYSSMFTGTEDDFEDDYRMPSRPIFGRRGRIGLGLPSRRSRRRRGFTPGPYFDDSDDDFDDYDDYEDDWDDDDDYGGGGGYCGRRQQRHRWLY
ncbi:hypothetical protein EK21DRAFT_93066 [Setomelanomma holmii]|uniref:Uncharacterized protein n=1 Tax=Setomelanomma holmii TaxID=210430 RepID=A0A9P4H128_9PLEO|nr:hypothetical protein EK21DRAFT_93066 [Setomelanomma holmii]